ncbi:Hpt domain-containing protein [Oxalobacteraceae bacterium A2-2]
MSRTDLPTPAATAFDTGPLSWVMGEIREALARSRTALFEAGGRDPEDQATQLQLARSHLHQAHGALQMVDVEGVGLLTASAEAVLDRFKDGSLKCSADHVRLVAQLYQALAEYLEQLLEGEPQQPARLFPYYRAVRELLGVERIHPADLFFPDLERATALAGLVAEVAEAPDLAALRQRFERALLPYLKSAEPQARREHAAALRDAVAALAASRTDGRQRVFWEAMQAFAELVAEDRVADGLYAKQLFGQINLQLRRLAQGAAETPDAMLRDALFFIAAAGADGGELPATARQLYQEWGLQGLAPADYEAHRYGQVDAEALARAREEVAQAKAVWERQAGGDSGAPLDPAFGAAVRGAAAATDKLGLPALGALLRQVDGVARTAGRSEELALEMSTALLFAEHGLARLRLLPDDFAAHADTIGARLQALESGATPPEPARWQSSLAYQMRQDDTVVTLAAELKTGLRHVEKVLDEFHADPALWPVLTGLDPVLHQLQGALAILEQDAAMRAVQHVKAAVRELAQGKAEPGQKARALEAIAQNVGALGFFVDMLGQNADGARARFAFDAAQGTFRSVPFRKMAEAGGIPVLNQQVPPPLPLSLPQQAPAPAPSDAAIEPELLEVFIDEAREVFALLDSTLPGAGDQAGAQEWQATLRRSFHTLKGSGRMVGLNQFADAAGAVERVMNVWLAESRPMTPPLRALLDHAARELRDWVDELSQAGVSPRNAEGLQAAAARVEQGGEFAPPPAPLALDGIEPLLPAQQIGVLPLPDDAPAPRLAGEIQALAPAEDVPPFAQLPLGVPPWPDLDAGEAPVATQPELAQAVPTAPPAGEEPWDAQSAPLLTPADLPPAGPEAGLPPGGNVIEFPTVSAPQVQREDDRKRIGELDIPLALYNIYLHECDELVRLLSRDFSEWRHEPRRPVSAAAQQAVHTLVGSSATVGFQRMRELAFALEGALQKLEPPAPQLDQAQHDLLDFAVERIRQMLQGYSQGDMPAAQPELIAALDSLREQLGSAPPAASPDIEARLDRLFADTLDSIMNTRPGAPQEAPEEGAAPADEVAAAAPLPGESPLDQLFRLAYHSLSGSVPEPAPRPVAAPKKAPAQDSSDIDDLFNSAFDDAYAEPPLTQIAAPPAPAADSAGDLFEAALAAAMEPAPEPETETETETETEHVPEANAEAEPELEPAPAHEPGAEPEQASGPGQEPPAAPGAIPELDTSAEVIALDPAEPLATSPASYQDELDPELLPVFLEEGADLLPQVGQALRAWQHEPGDSGHPQTLRRILHTVKGSARMAGAMRLGQHAHDIETHIETMVRSDSATPQAFDELLAHYDHAMLLFEQLQQPDAPLAPAPAGTEGAAAAEAATEAEEEPGARSPLVRVRADLLDRLVNQAGEVSISRSRLENEVGALRGALAEFSDNLARLQRQLREVEMQAESQIASRMAVSSEREFDPLEFDRFTRLQELTRMMAESVNDVASFHEGLARGVETATEDLALQARLTRELQRDLMRVRMVPFGAISERLFRVARQSAKEVDKRVNLDIRGSAVEIDRGVLERMAAPFEHLLRNAIAHGIESRAARAAAGKSETGELLVEVAQEGNEVVIAFSDDGAGLDLERIRAKARATGLLAEGQEISDVQAADLIFQPGFSTADTLTELSGRGVGMDVVQSEAQALGGRVDLRSDSGKGTCFTIRLPLTLAVSQVVLVTAGGKTHAVPTMQVEQVLQARQEVLDEARRAGQLQLHGQHAALHYLPQLLGDAGAPPQRRSAPVLVLKNGNERLALQVDEVIGNREVVIKNVGPQLSRLVGIAGATVLGSGDIVLILNPVALAQHLVQHPELRGQYAQAAGDCAQALPRGRTVMVVDDSLTVRRVTQRLLEREGFHVLLAKDGVDALEQLQAVRPELMLVDIEMPRMDGFDLVRNVRADQRTQDIPVIMITSRSADKHRNYALQLGVNAYFGKPYQEDELLAAIDGMLKPQAS